MSLNAKETTPNENQKRRSFEDDFTRILQAVLSTQVKELTKICTNQS